ncbi:hypothetical protein KVX96_02145 [Pseudoruegeria sp. SHC-113]|nr:hypothetical protein [Pseudoruegeria sp. SHC-113]
MSFVRKEVKSAIWRWREFLIGWLFAAVGVILIFRGLGFVPTLGIILGITGALLAYAGVQRARFRLGEGGPGVVHVNEGRIAYYGPFSGGAVSVDGLSKVELDPVPDPAPHWVLRGIESPPLFIPANAEGVDALFDVFSSIKNFPTEQMLRYLTQPPAHPVVIWQKEQRMLH